MSGSIGKHLQRSLGVGCRTAKSCPLQLTIAKTRKIVTDATQTCATLSNCELIDDLRCWARLRGCIDKIFGCEASRRQSPRSDSNLALRSLGLSSSHARRSLLADCKIIDKVKAMYSNVPVPQSFPCASQNAGRMRQH